MSKDDYMGMVTTIIMYTMHKRALRNKLEKLKSPYEQWHDYGFSFTSWLHVDFIIMYPDGLPIDEQHEPSIDFNMRSKDKFHWTIAASSCIVILLATSTLLWPCVLIWITDGSFSGICTKPSLVENYAKKNHIQNRLQLF